MRLRHSSYIEGETNRFIGASYGVFEDALFTSLVLGTLIGTAGAIYKDVIQGGN